MKVNKNINVLLLIVSVGMVYAGFRLVTQAGQGLAVAQNDGYASTGGILIFAGGAAIGRLVGEYYERKSKK